MNTEAAAPVKVRTFYQVSNRARESFFVAPALPR